MVLRPTCNYTTRGSIGHLVCSRCNESAPARDLRWKGSITSRWTFTPAAILRASVYVTGIEFRAAERSARIDEWIQRRPL